MSETGYISSTRNEKLSDRQRRYWQRQGLLPEKEDRSVLAERIRRFVDSCLKLGFRPTKLKKIQRQIESKDRMLHHLSVYQSESNLLCSELVFYDTNGVQEAHSTQQLFDFSNVSSKKGQLISFSPSFDAVYHDSPNDKVLAQRLKDWLRQNPDSIEALIELGNLSFKKKKYDKALAYYQEALQVNDSCAEVVYNMAGCYVEQKQYATAIRLYHQSIALQPLAEAWFGLGLVYLLVGYNKLAISSFQSVVDLGPSDWLATAMQLIEDVQQFNGAAE